MRCCWRRRRCRRRWACPSRRSSRSRRRCCTTTRRGPRCRRRWPARRRGARNWPRSRRGRQAADAAVRQARAACTRRSASTPPTACRGPTFSRPTRSGASGSRWASRCSSGGSRGRGSVRRRPAAAASRPSRRRRCGRSSSRSSRPGCCVKEALERQVVTKKIRELAEEDLRVSEGRYQEGLGTMLEVIDARTALTQAGTNAVIARYDSAQARARLERALGNEIAGGDEMKKKQWVVVGVVLAAVTTGAVPAYRKYAGATAAGAAVPDGNRAAPRHRLRGPGDRGHQGEGRRRGQGRRAHLRAGREALRQHRRRGHQGPADRAAGAGGPAGEGQRGPDEPPGRRGQPRAGAQELRADAATSSRRTTWRATRSTSPSAT